MSFKSKYLHPDTPTDHDAELRDYGVMLLAEHGYRQDGYNPHNVRAWAIQNEFGTFAVEVGTCEHDALDLAVDNNKMDSMLMSDADRAEYDNNGWDDCYITAGNASEAFYNDYLHITELV